MSIHYPEDFSYLEIWDYKTQSLEIAIDRIGESNITNDEDSSHTQDAAFQYHGEEFPNQVTHLQAHASDAQGSSDSHQQILRPANTFSPFTRLPTELQREVLFRIARPLLEVPRIVEIHEASLRVRYLASNGDKGDVNIKHFRSKTPIPPIFNTCYKAREVCWTFFDQECPLGNELCPDTVLFNFERDAAYFTNDTLLSWMSFWKRCSSRHPEYPLNDGAGLELRKSLKRIVFDVCLLMGADMVLLSNGGLAQGDSSVLEALGPGLLAFPALEEITLVVSAKDAGIHADNIKLHSVGAELIGRETLDADQELSSMTLVAPEPDSIAAEVLEEASDFLAQHLDWYFNHWVSFEDRPSMAYHTGLIPRIRTPRPIPTIRTMVRDI